MPQKPLVSKVIKKENCHWFLHRYGFRRGCGVLEKLQCECNGKCSFYETEEQYKTRQESFRERERNAFQRAGVRAHLL